MSVDDIVKDAKIQPMSKAEIDSLKDRSANAIFFLNSWNERMIQDKGENEATRIFTSAIEIFTELRKEWLLAVGNPLDIRGDAIEKILKTTIKILQQRNSYIRRAKDNE